MNSQILLSAPGGQEWILIFIIVLLLFGAKRIPEVARSLGSGIREFKKSMNGDTEDQTDSSKPDSGHQKNAAGSEDKNT